MTVTVVQMRSPRTAQERRRLLPVSLLAAPEPAAAGHAPATAGGVPLRRDLYGPAHVRARALRLRRRRRDDQPQPARHAQRALATSCSTRCSQPSTAADDDDARVVVLASTHETTFSSAATSTASRGRAAGPQVHRHGRFPRLFRADRHARQADDLRRQRARAGGRARRRAGLRPDDRQESATFGTPEINVGVFPFMIMALIYRNVPRKKATELLLLGERIDAREAERSWGSSTASWPTTSSTPRSPTGPAARGEVAAAHAAGQGRDVAPAGHGARRRARLPARPARARVRDRGHPARA